jgi:predicted negative regulator of RcsB-dependent stress response
MSNRNLIIIGSVAALAVGGFIAWKMYQKKQTGNGMAPVPTNSTGTGTNTTMPGESSEWLRTISGLYVNISGIFSGNSTRNTNDSTQANGAAVRSTVNDMADFLNF